MRTTSRRSSSGPQACLWQWADCASRGTQRGAPQLRLASSRPSTPPRASAAHHGAHAGGAPTGAPSLTPMPDHPPAHLRAQTWRAACPLRCTWRAAGRGSRGPPAAGPLSSGGPCAPQLRTASRRACSASSSSAASAGAACAAFGALGAAAPASSAMVAPATSKSTCVRSSCRVCRVSGTAAPAHRYSHVDGVRPKLWCAHWQNRGANEAEADSEAFAKGCTRLCESGAAGLAWNASVGMKDECGFLQKGRHASSHLVDLGLGLLLQHLRVGVHGVIHHLRYDARLHCDVCWVVAQC